MYCIRDFTVGEHLQLLGNYVTVIVWCFLLFAFALLYSRKVFQIGTVRYNWPMSAHAYSQAFSIAHCTDSEDLYDLIIN